MNQKIMSDHDHVVICCIITIKKLIISAENILTRIYNNSKIVIILNLLVPI